MAGNKVIKSTKDIAIISALTAILFVQEQLLTSLPGVQLSIFLIVLYSKTLGLAKSSIIVVLHVLLDNLYMGSFSVMYTPSMLVGWLLIPITLCTIFKNVESPIILGVLGIIYSFVYCWLYMIPNYLIAHIDPIAYLISDIIFEIILAVCSFLTIILLYKPCKKAISLLLNDK